MYKLITKNFGVKIFCLVSATVLWAYVSAGQNTVGKFPGSIKVKAINTPQNLEAIYDAKIVNIKIMAEPTIWQRLSADTFSAYIDLSGLSEGTHEVPVTVTSSIPGVQIVEKNPDKIFVSLEPLITRELAITSRTEGEAAEGMIPGSISFDPSKAIVRGPESIVSSLNEISSIIHLNGESSDFEKNVKLVALDSQGDPISGIEILPSEAKAMISVVKASNNKTVGIKVKVTGEPKEGYYVSSVSASPSTVDITGKSSTLSEVNFIETFGIDISDKSTDFEVEVNLNIKNGIALQSGSPDKIKVSIKFGASEISKKIAPTISYLGLPENYSVTNLDPSNIEIICSGPDSILSSLGTKDVFLTLDFRQKVLGEEKEELVISLSESDIKVPDQIKISSFLPTSIRVVLSRK